MTIDFDQDDLPILGLPTSRYHWDGNSGALSTWMDAYTADNGAGSTYVVNDPKTDVTGVTMKTAKRASSTAIISGPTIDLADHRVVKFRTRFDGLPGGTTMGILQIGLTQQPTPTRGVIYGKFRMDAYNQPTLVRTTAAENGAPVSRYLLTDMPYFNNGRKYDIVLMLDTESKDLYLMYGDVVVSMWPNMGAYLELGQVTASVRVANNAGTAEERGLFLRSFTLETFE